MRLKRILVAVKPWNTGLPLAAEHARMLAQALDAELILMSSVYDSDVAFRLERGNSAAAAAQRGLIAGEETDLDGLTQSLRDWGVRVRTRVVWERVVYQAILREVERSRADLLVVGAHAPQFRPHSRLTDTDWQLMRLSPCPLLLVKDPELDGYDRMLAAVDPLHAHAEPAGLDHSVLETACYLREAFDAELHVAHACPAPEQFALVSSVEVLPGVFYGAENIESVHRKAAVELIAPFGIGPGQLEMRPGDPARVITDIAADRRIDLVIIGALKRSRLEQALLGSTAEAVAAEVGCDVLFVKPRR